MSRIPSPNTSVCTRLNIPTSNKFKVDSRYIDDVPVFLKFSSATEWTLTRRPSLITIGYIHIVLLQLVHWSPVTSTPRVFTPPAPGCAGQLQSNLSRETTPSK